MCSHWLKGVHWFYRYVSYPQQSVIKCVINVHNIQGRLHANLLLQTYPAFATTIKIHKKSNLEVKNDVLYKFIVQRVVALQSFRGKKHIVTLSMWQCASLKKFLNFKIIFSLQVAEILVPWSAQQPTSTSQTTLWTRPQRPKSSLKTTIQISSHSTEKETKGKLVSKLLRQSRF